MSAGVGAIGYTGTIRITVTTSTMVYQRTYTYQAGELTDSGTPTQTGGWQPNQIYTVSGLAVGTGYWEVYVHSS